MKTAYRFSYQLGRMPRAAVRYLSHFDDADARRQQFAKVGGTVTPIVRVKVSPGRTLDDWRFGLSEKPALLSTPQQQKFA